MMASNRVRWRKNLYTADCNLLIKDSDNPP